jgi:hypothetical protein
VFPTEFRVALRPFASAAKLKLTAIAVAVTVALALVGTASSYTLKVIGSGRASGQFAVTAASGSKSNAHVVYIRGYGRGLSGHGVVACARGFSVGSKSKSYSRMTPGVLYKVPLPMLGDCDVTASLSGSGTIRLQILAG